MATQADIRYSIKVNGKTKFEVVHFSHKESLSKLFKTKLKLVSKEGSPVFSDILDNPVTLTLFKGDELIRHINGIVTKFKQGKSGFRRTHYKMQIEPELSRANLIQDSRHWQNKTSQQIIEMVLKQSGVSHFKFMQISQAGKPQIREFCQQYRETNLAFIQRLAAEEGFYYYFEHKADQHILHFADSTQAANRVGDLLYNPNPSGDQPEPCLWQADYQEQIASTKMATKDYNFKNPNYRLNQKAQKKTNETGDYEIFDSPGRFAYNEAGKPFTQTRLEELRRDSITISAKGDDMRVIPGYRMKLQGHPREALNDEWVFVSIQHEGYQPGVLQEEAPAVGKKGEDPQGSYYKNQIQMIPWNVQWKADTQHKPVVDGSQIATVVGPKGEEIYCDEHPRVASLA